MSNQSDYLNISKEGNLADFKEGKEEGKQLPFFSDSSISHTSNNGCREDLIHAFNYDKVRTLANGCNIKEASRRTGIPFSTLHKELKFWEFAGLVKLRSTEINGYPERLIECLPLDSSIKSAEGSPLTPSVDAHELNRGILE